MSIKPAPKRSLWPKEHGAYAQLFVPLLSAFGVGWPGGAGLLWTVAATLVFAAHEPALVLLGRRGQRAQNEAGPRARRWLIGQLMLATLATGFMLWLEPNIGPSVGLVALGGLVVLGFVLKRAEKSAPGEAIAAAALCGPSLVILILAGMPMAEAALHWAAWALGFVAVTGGVRGVIAFHKGRIEPWAWPLLGLSAAGCVASSLVAPVVAAASPLILAGWVLKFMAPRPRHLRTIGVVLVVASVGTGALLVLLTAFPLNAQR